MTEALARYNASEIAAPSASIYDRMADPLEAAERLGTWIAKSRLLGVETPDQGIVVALTCMQERITPLEFRRRYHVIKGSPSMRADYMQAAFQAAGGRVRWDRTDDEVAIVTVTHQEHAPAGFTNSVALDVLSKRGLTSDNYKRYPRQMLRARAVSEAIRAVMPAINAGEYTAEELDEPATVDVSTPPGVPTGAAVPMPDPAIGDRAKKAIAAFRSLGVTQDDLERHLGRPASAWGADDFDALTAARKAIADAPIEERAEKTRAVFDLEPGALG